VGLAAFDESHGSVAKHWSVPTGLRIEDASSVTNIPGTKEAKFFWAGGFQMFEKSYRDEYDHHDLSVKGDDDFVVLASKDGFVVWCFDETITLPSNDGFWWRW